MHFYSSEFAVDVAGFTFVNNLPLSKDIQKFIDKVKEQRTYFNLDEPEGSLDALIQVIACQRVNLRISSLFYFAKRTFG